MKKFSSFTFLSPSEFRLRFEIFWRAKTKKKKKKPTKASSSIVSCVRSFLIFIELRTYRWETRWILKKKTKERKKRKETRFSVVEVYKIIWPVHFFLLLHRRRCCYCYITLVRFLYYTFNSKMLHGIL